MRLLAVLALVAVAGCLGSAVGPGIPDAALGEARWSKTGDAHSTAYGVVDVAQSRYAPRAAGEAAGIFVVSVSDVPVLDEDDFVPDQVESYARAEGITLRDAGTEDLELESVGILVTAKLYDVEGTAVPAKAVLVTFHCPEPDAFVAVVGYGALPQTGGILAGATADLFGQAKSLVRKVSCRA